MVLTQCSFCFSLQIIISRLEQSPALSFSGRLLLVLSIIQHADIRPASYESSTLSYLNDSLSAYKRGMTHVLDQVIKRVAVCTSCATVLCPYLALLPYFAMLSLLCAAILRRHLAPHLVPPSCPATLRRHLAPPSCTAILHRHLAPQSCTVVSQRHFFTVNLCRYTIPPYCR